MNYLIDRIVHFYSIMIKNSVSLDSIKFKCCFVNHDKVVVNMKILKIKLSLF